MARLSASQRAFLQDNPFVGTVTTLRSDGSPHSTVVWVDTEATRSCASTRRAAASSIVIWNGIPRVSLVVIDPQEMYRWVGVTGTAELTEEGADDHIDALAKTFLGADTYPFRRPGQVRVMVRIHVEKVDGIGLDA